MSEAVRRAKKSRQGGGNTTRTLRLVADLGSRSASAIGGGSMTSPLGQNVASTIRDAREREKKEISVLNDRLAGYIEKVRFERGRKFSSRNWRHFSRFASLKVGRLIAANNKSIVSLHKSGAFRCARIAAQNRKIATDFDGLQDRHGKDTATIEALYDGELKVGVAANSLFALIATCRRRKSSSARPRRNATKLRRRCERLKTRSKRQPTSGRATHNLISSIGHLDSQSPSVIDLSMASESPR